MCANCVKFTPPTHTLVCVNYHCTPVHDQCIRAFNTCSSCHYPAIGLIVRSVKDAFTDSGEFHMSLLSEDMLERARLCYKSWHLRQFHARWYDRKANLTAAVHDAPSKNVNYSGTFKCYDWAPEQDQSSPKSAFLRLQASERKTMKEEKAEIKRYFEKNKYAAIPPCSVCVWSAAGNPRRPIELALPSASCPVCEVALCAKHLRRIYTEREWDKVLLFSAKIHPRLAVNCMAPDCNDTFCKFRIFPIIPDRFSDLIHLGKTNVDLKPHPFSRLCLAKQITPATASQSFVCELTGPRCGGHVFCSFECKAKHCGTCKECSKPFHISEKSDIYCDVCFNQLKTNEVHSSSEDNSIPTPEQNRRFMNHDAVEF